MLGQVAIVHVVATAKAVAIASIVEIADAVASVVGALAPHVAGALAPHVAVVAAAVVVEEVEVAVAASGSAGTRPKI